MSVLQYVGARYVPKLFDDGNGGMEWKVDTYYEPLTIVTYNNASYISRVPVAASVGNPADNGSVWARTGNYNSFLQQLQEDLDALGSKIDANAASSLQFQANQLWNNPENNVVLFGDSWLDVKNDSNVRIPAVLEAALGCKTWNYSQGGTGFNVSGGYNDQIDLMSADANLDKASITAVILVAGLNEYNPGHSATSFYRNLMAWYRKLRRVTSAPVYWFFNYSMTNEIRENGYNTTYYSQKDYFEYVQNNVGSPIKCINMQGWVEFSSQVNNWNTANYYHPNAAGSTDCGVNIARTLMGLEPILHCYFYERLTWTQTSSPGLARTDVEMRIENGRLIARMYTPKYALMHPNAKNYPVSISRNLPGKIRTIPAFTDNGYIAVSSSNELAYSVTVYDTSLTSEAESGVVVCDGLIVVAYSSDV